MQSNKGAAAYLFEDASIVSRNPAMRDWTRLLQSLGFWSRPDQAPPSNWSQIFGAKRTRSVLLRRQCTRRGRSVLLRRRCTRRTGPGGSHRSKTCWARSRSWHVWGSLCYKRDAPRERQLSEDNRIALLLALATQASLPWRMAPLLLLVQRPAWHTRRGVTSLEC